MSSNVKPPEPNPRDLWATLASGQRAVLTAVRDAARAEGGEAYLVGGPVRDLLHRSASLRDIDLLTTVDARAVARRLTSTLPASVDKTTDFGTATVHLPTDDGVAAIDIATARTETYPRPGALPVVTFPASVASDLHRRDFTINALALPIGGDGFGTLLDPTDGLADLRDGIVRVLHDASFRDDPTRLYRALRYAARFGFALASEMTTLFSKALANDALATISSDRKRHELELGLQEADRLACFAAFDMFGLLRATSPVLVWDDWVARRARLIGNGTWPIWAFFVCRQGEEAVERLIADIPLGALWPKIRGLVRVWEEREFIASARNLSSLRPLLEKQTEREALILLDGEPAAVHAAQFYARLDHVDRQDRQRGRSVGNYLKELGVTPGPVYRDILHALRDARLDGDAETIDACDEFVRRYVEERRLGPLG